MFKPSRYGITPPPNHRCPSCGRTFLNNKDSQCYNCGQQDCDRGEEAGLSDIFNPNEE